MGPISAKEGQRKWWCLLSIQGLFKNWQNWQEQAENFLMKHVGD